MLAVEYVHATTQRQQVLPSHESFRLDDATLRGERALVVVDFSPTTQLAAVTLTFDPLTLKLVHVVLVSRGSFLPSLVFVGLFVFPLGGGTGQTDKRTDGRTEGRTDRQRDGQHRYIMGPPSRKDDPIITQACVDMQQTCLDNKETHSEIPQK